MTGKIFINYRRGDDPGTTGRLYDRLEAEFAAGQLFMDVEGHIRGGDDFVKVLQAQVAQCDVLLAVIGPRWLEVADEQGRRRLDNPEDWVRVEIVGALQDGKRVIPVLVGGAEMPRAEELPEDLKPLARRQAIRITLQRFKADTQGLVSQIKSALAEVEAQRHAETETERAALAEAERQRQTAEEARVAERVRQEAERLRAAQLAGMDPAQVRKAEELANWEFIKGKSEPAEFRDHIARFVGGPTERFAEERLAGLTWSTLDRADKAALRAFIDEFPKAPDLGAAKAALATVEAKEAAEREAAARQTAEIAAWGAVAASSDRAKIEEFLKAWPDGQHASDAKTRLRELTYGALGKRIAAVPPALSLSVVALASWLVGLILAGDFLSIAYLVAPALSALLSGLSIYLFTDAASNQAKRAAAVSALLSVVSVMLLLPSGNVDYSGANLPIYLTCLTLATLVGPALVNSQLRRWHVIVLTPIFPLFGASPGREVVWESVYLWLLPTSVLWAIALGLMVSRLAAPANPENAAKALSRSAEIPQVAPLTPTRATPEQSKPQTNGAQPRRSWLRRFGRMLLWLLYWVVAGAVAIGMARAGELLGESIGAVVEIRAAFAIVGAAMVLIAAFFLAGGRVKRSRGKSAGSSNGQPLRQPIQSTDHPSLNVSTPPSNSGT
jgi:hypothetical protein